MKGIAHTQISAILRITHPKNYSDWKYYRKKLANDIGEQLLTLDENGINNEYNLWESEILKYSKKNTEDKKYDILLLISLLHYFKHSYDQSSPSFQILFGFLSSNDHETTRTSGKVLHYIGKENIGTFAYFREILELASQFMSPAQIKVLAFSGLIILKTLVKFLPKEVSTIITAHEEEIFNFILNRFKCNTIAYSW